MNTTAQRVNTEYPRWKIWALLLVLVWGVIYALPNVYGEVPAIQITPHPQADVSLSSVQTDLLKVLKAHHVSHRSILSTRDYVQVTFKTADAQWAAKSIIEKAFPSQLYTVAMTLAPATPESLRAMGALPMKYGLDLRGGIHFFLDVDMNSVLKQRFEGDVRGFTTLLREKKIRYSGVEHLKDKGVSLHFKTAKVREAAFDALRVRFPQCVFTVSEQDPTQLTVTYRDTALQQMKDDVLTQTMTVLRNRVDELGVSNAAVQRQGVHRIAVDLPGVLDAGHAEKILGSTATLAFHLVDEEHTSLEDAPWGTKSITWHDRPLLLKQPAVLKGSSITHASTSMGQEGYPTVNVHLGGGGEALFHRVTRDNIGKRMAIVYTETHVTHQTVGGKSVKRYQQSERVISAPTIRSALPNDFEITGFETSKEALNVAMLLRAGALPATIDIVQKRIVGPSLGRANIHKGLVSIGVGLLAIMVFMALYYRGFGMLANIALLSNLVLLVALLSFLGMVLTLPGIAGIVLTVGMAVDANVLIFERIREELRNGSSFQAAIFAGFDRAFATIVDANLTTFIAAVALFSIGAGPIKGFAVTLTVGLLTSMLTAVSGTRALVHLVYGKKALKPRAIGL